MHQGLSENTRTILVLFDLLLALALGLWAWSVSRRYAGRVQPALDVQAANNSWEQLRANELQPAFLFNGFSGELRTTDELALSLRDTETLVAIAPPLPNYTSSEALLSLGVFMAGRTQFGSMQTPQPQPTPIPMGRQNSLFGYPATDYVQPAPTPVPGTQGPGFTRSRIARPIPPYARFAASHTSTIRQYTRAIPSAGQHWRGWWWPAESLSRNAKQKRARTGSIVAYLLLSVISLKTHPRKIHGSLVSYVSVGENLCDATALPLPNVKLLTGLCHIFSSNGFALLRFGDNSARRLSKCTRTYQ